MDMLEENKVEKYQETITRYRYCKHCRLVAILLLGLSAGLPEPGFLDGAGAVFLDGAGAVFLDGAGAVFLSGSSSYSYFTVICSKTCNIFGNLR